MSSRACTRCRGKTEPTVIERAGGESEPVAVSLEGMPALACERGHKQFVFPDFARQVAEHLIEEDEARLPAGQEKGLIFKHYHCGACGAELTAEPDHRETFPFELRVGELSPFRVAITAPVYRCPQCSREQLHSLKELRSHTPEALAHAFQAADIPPA